MGRHVHARIRKKKFVFRVWSSVVDDYLTEEELTEKELKDFLLKEAVCNAIDAFNHGIEGRLQRAKSCGTSELKKGIKEDLDGPWKKE